MYWIKIQSTKSTGIQENINRIKRVVKLVSLGVYDT